MCEIQGSVHQKCHKNLFFLPHLMFPLRNVLTNQRGGGAGRCLSEGGRGGRGSRGGREGVQGGAPPPPAEMNHIH